MKADNAKSEVQSRYEEYWMKKMADPEFRRTYEEESVKKELSLLLMVARQEAGPKD